MKKFFQKRAVAWVVLVLAVALSVGIGLTKDRSESKDAAAYGFCVEDDAGILSKSAEDKLAKYNADWDAKYYTRVIVKTLSQAPAESLEDYAYDRAMEAQLNENDDHDLPKRTPIRPGVYRNEPCHARGGRCGKQRRQEPCRLCGLRADRQA